MFRGLRRPEQLRGKKKWIDEVHRIADPSLLLKIAADEYPGLRILATGSSTLAATGKFRDSLTGRKRDVQPYPVLWEECDEPFGIADLDRRLLHGGLPESLLRGTKNPIAFAEWIDSFFARDILELFRVLVLDSLRFRHLDENIFYWRDKAGHEVDFVVRRDEGRLDTFECKIDPDEVEARAVKAFRRRYPAGRDYVVVPGARQLYRIRRGGREFTVCGTGGLPEAAGSS